MKPGRHPLPCVYKASWPAPRALASIFAPPNFAFLECKFYRNERIARNEGGCSDDRLGPGPTASPSGSDQSEEKKFAQSSSFPLSPRVEAPIFLSILPHKFGMLLLCRKKIRLLENLKILISLFYEIVSRGLPFIPFRARYYYFGEIRLWDGFHLVRKEGIECSCQLLGNGMVATWLKNTATPW